MKLKPEKFLSCVFICVIILLTCSVFYQVSSRKIEKNSSNEPEEINIDWTKLYPFESESDSESAQNTQFTQGGGGVLRRIYKYLKEKLTNYTSNKLEIYGNIIENAKRYEDFIKWDIAYMGDYNPVVKLKDGYLTTFTPSRDVTKDARSTIEIANFCESLDIKFLYINLPNKICVSQDKDISGILDFSNQNADNFLNLLKEFGVKYYDIRKILHEQGMNHHEAFFRTDHHWKPETGLWAAGKILKFLRDDYNWPVNPDILNPENFERVIYRDCFLGSEGKKVTLIRTKPDDISLIYPKFDNLLHYNIPSIGLNISSDFRIIYDMRSFKQGDYYRLNPYGGYNYGDRPLTIFRNQAAGCDKKILFIHDSFGNSIVPFIALEVKNVLEIEGAFTGSIRSYIKSTMPDAVIAMYYINNVGKVKNMR